MAQDDSTVSGMHQCQKCNCQAGDCTLIFCDLWDWGCRLNTWCNVVLRAWNNCSKCCDTAAARMYMKPSCVDETNLPNSAISTVL